MSRLQNVLLVVWGAVLLGLIASNWRAVWAPLEVTFLFVSFDSRLVLWLMVGAFALPLLFRWLASRDRGAARREAEAQVERIKSQAFDDRGGDLDRMMEQLRERLEAAVNGLIDQRLGNKQPPLEGGAGTSQGNDA